MYFCTFFAGISLKIWCADNKKSNTNKKEPIPIDSFFNVTIYLLTLCIILLAADGVGPLSRGPHELREWVGRAEALSASNSPSEFCALQLPNAKFKLLIFIFFCREQCWRSGIVVSVVVLILTLLTTSQRNDCKQYIPAMSDKLILY